VAAVQLSTVPQVSPSHQQAVRSTSLLNTPLRSQQHWLLNRFTFQQLLYTAVTKQIRLHVHDHCLTLYSLKFIPVTF